MTDQEKRIIKAVSEIRAYCKGTGCLYCIFHRIISVFDENPQKSAEYCVLDNYPRNWPEKHEEDQNDGI